MIFNSVQFLLFFPIVVLVYYILFYIPGYKKTRTFWLLIASYYFYACWNVKYLVLIFTSTVITYISGRLLSYINSTCLSDKKISYRNCVVALSFTLNLGILFAFKYFGFFARIATVTFGKIGIAFNIPNFDPILPVGISFYTFQALSYTMDVYRGDIDAEKDFMKYALFVSFFPQLVAGPIERSKNLLSQLEASNKFSVRDTSEGILLILWGYFLKIVIADRLAIFVDRVYSDYSMYYGWYIVVATLFFAVQIYCDFYGYSTIAMGASKILGITLMENFNAPYLSTSVAEFWRNWHISLSSWFKDYLYIPLGGSRKGKVRKYINILIVFLVSGLWHGAAFSFVIWGLLNGIFQIIGEILRPIFKKIGNIFSLDSTLWSSKLIKALGTFFLVDFAWLFFRAPGVKDAILIIKNIFKNNIWILFDESIFNCGLDAKDFNLIFVSIGILLIADILKKRGTVIRKEILSQNFWFRCCVYVISLAFILIFGIWGPGYDAANFIYFQF